MSNWNEVGGGKTRAAEQRFWLAVGENVDTVVDRINNSPEFADSMAQFAIRGGPQPSMSVQRAREIMKNGNFFGIEEGMRHMNAKFSRFELAGFSEVPATDEELEEISETHIVAAVPSISVVTMRERVTKPNVYRTDNTWHLEQPLATRVGLPRYQVIRKTPVPKSTNRKLSDQLPLLGANEEVPSVRVLHYVMGGHYLATDEKLFSDVWVRTSDVDSGGVHVRVGFDSDGVYVCYGWVSLAYPGIGLASAWKSN